jgi:hypothetical protein
MIRTCARASVRSTRPCSRTLPVLLQPVIRLHFSSTALRSEDPRIANLGREIKDEYAVIREKYGTYSTLCRLPIVDNPKRRQRTRLFSHMAYWASTSYDSEDDTCRAYSIGAVSQMRWQKMASKSSSPLSLQVGVSRRERRSWQRALPKRQRASRSTSSRA